MIISCPIVLYSSRILQILVAGDNITEEGAAL